MKSNRKSKSKSKSKHLESLSNNDVSDSGTAVQRRWKTGQACVSKPTVRSHRDIAMSLPKKSKSHKKSSREHNLFHKQSKVSNITPIPVVEKMITDALQSLRGENPSNRYFHLCNNTISLFFTSI